MIYILETSRLYDLKSSPGRELFVIGKLQRAHLAMIPMNVKAGRDSPALPGGKSKEDQGLKRASVWQAGFVSNPCPLLR